MAIIPKCRLHNRMCGIRKSKWSAMLSGESLYILINHYLTNILKSSICYQYPVCVTVRCSFFSVIKDLKRECLYDMTHMQLTFVFILSFSSMYFDNVALFIFCISILLLTCFLPCHQPSLKSITQKTCVSRHRTKWISMCRKNHDLSP